MANRRIQRIPILTLFLIFANLFVAFAVFIQPQLLDTLAFNPQEPSLVNALTCLFVHVNVVHLLGNLIFLAAAGPIVEFSKGSWKTALVYLLSGICGVIAYWTLAGRSVAPLPLVGASAAIAGCVAFSAVRYMRTKVPVFVNVAIPVGVLALAWLALQIVGAFVRIGDVTAADSGFWPHLGGILGGLILAAILGADTDAKRAFGHSVLDKMNERGPAASLAAAKQHLVNHPNDIKALWQQADAEIDLGENNASVTLLKLLTLESSANRAQVIKSLQKIRKLHLINSAERLKFADELLPTNPSMGEILIRSIVDQESDDRKPEAILALVELIKDQRPEEAQLLASRLSRDFELHPATQAAKSKGLLP